MLKRLFIFSFMLIIFTVCNTAFAKTNSIENISYTIEKNQAGQDYLHIELSTNYLIKDFSANINPNNNHQLIFRLNNTKLSNIPRQENLDGNIGKKIFLQEIDNDYIQGKLYTQSELTNKNYKIYTIKKDKKHKKNAIAIDVFSTSQGINQSTKSIAGVKNKTITLDAGHGGSDSGAIGPNGYMEKEATLAITQDLADILINSGATIKMTRTDDVDVYGPNASDVNELQARVNVANRANSDILISIHCNAFTNPAANGTQTFYYGSSSSSKRLSDLIQKEMIKTNKLYNRGISTANFYVLKHSYMPAVLIETAFITNPKEEQLLNDSNWQMQLAESIADGIEQYFNQ